MMKIGKRQKLTVLRETEHGLYLAERETDAKDAQVLLPAREVPEGSRPGDVLDVFLYRDSEDRPVATTAVPRIALGEVKLLEVREVNARVGAFLDWGLPRDLLLPFAEQTRRVQEGEQVLVAMYLDKTERLCATMNVYDYLRTYSPYRVGDEVHGRIYEMSENFGVFVAVDDLYSGRIPKQEAQGHFVIGEVRKLRVTQVLEDGRLNLSARQKAYQQINPDAELIREYLRYNDGVIPYDDTATPAQIAEDFGLSKAAFKRALGHLIKSKEVKKEGGRIIGLF